LAIEVRSLEVCTAEDIDSAFEVARNERPDALLTVEDPLTFSYQQRIAGFAVANQLPSLHGVKEFALAGGLMSYGTNVADVYRRAASYVDKILKGASPADLPVQQPTRFELVINLQTAKKLRLAVSPLLLARADEVIE
jgi:putative tryptophan/tyrosine transport system substrate-binding protein